MEVAEELVLAAADIGLMLFQRASENAVKEAIRAFACRYGSLGIMTALPTTPRFIEYEKVYFNKNPFVPDRSETDKKDVPDETMDTKDYIRLFFPFREPDFQKQGKVKKNAAAYCAMATVEGKTADIEVAQAWKNGQ